jgi:hypothetical protein
MSMSVDAARSLPAHIHVIQRCYEGSMSGVRPGVRNPAGHRTLRCRAAYVAGLRGERGAIEQICRRWGSLHASAGHLEQVPVVIDEVDPAGAAQRVVDPPITRIFGVVAKRQAAPPPGSAPLLTGRCLRAQRPRQFFRRDGVMPEAVEMRLTIPAELGPEAEVLEELRQRVAAAVAAIGAERQRTGSVCTADARCCSNRGGASRRASSRGATSDRG